MLFAPIISKTARASAAALSLPVDTAVADTLNVSGSATTDTASGTIYWGVYSSATPASAANIEAGTGVSGAFGSYAVSGTGVQALGATSSGLLGGITGYLQFVQKVGATYSNVVVGDGFTTSLYGPELMVNGQFGSNTTGWTGTNITLAAVSGRMRGTLTNANGRIDLAAAVTVVSGADHRYKRTFIPGTAPASISRGSSSNGGTQYWSTLGFYTSSVPDEIVFAPDTTTFWTREQTTATTGQVGEWDDMSLKRCLGTLQPYTYGSNLNPNTDNFATTTGWIGFTSATISAVSNRLRVTRAAGAAAGGARINPNSIAVTVGQKYELSADIYAGTSGGVPNLLVGATTNSSSQYGILGPMVKGIVFTAGTTTLYLGIVHNATVDGQYVELGNVKIRTAA